jgi:hypothetical protein
MKQNSVTHHSLKKAYPTKEAAEKVAAFLLTKFIQVRVYKCYCELWHLTGNLRGK